MMMKFSLRTCLGFSASILLIMCVWILTSSSIRESYLQEPMRSFVCSPSSDDYDLINIELRKVVEQIEHHAPKQAWAEDVLSRISRVAKLFDSHSQLPIKSIEPVLEREICPSRFSHYNMSFPYFLNGSWIEEKCNYSKPVEQLITVALYHKTQGGKCNVKYLLDEIQAMHPGIRIRIAVNCDLDSTKNVEAYKISEDDKSGKIWNKLVKGIQTPYVLIGRDLENFNWFAVLHRQILALNEIPSVEIAGGSFRNNTGHWQIGCYQTKMKFYQFIFEEGYHTSRNECIFCDHLLGPFIARTRLFDKMKFDEHISNAVVFEDFFWQLKRSMVGVVNCPDAMYFATDVYTSERVENRKTWLDVVKKYELNRIVLPDGVRHKYTCEESGSSCRDLYTRTGKRYMPVCCMDRVKEGLEKLHEFCRKNNILYYINGGTLLGAVKFGDVIPWDFDGDVIYSLSNISFFEHQKANFGDKTLYMGNFHLKRFGYFRINLPDMFIEMDGYNQTANDRSGMAKYFQVTPTLIRVRGVWVYGPPSPGLHARNQYGKEIYKHANSWTDVGMLWFDPYKVQNHFLKCDKPGHHYCYDTYPTDGSFYFTVP